MISRNEHILEIPSEYPDALRNLVPKFTARAFLRYIESTERIHTLKIDSKICSILMIICQRFLNQKKMYLFNNSVEISVKELMKASKSCDRTVRRVMQKMEESSVIEIIESIDPTTRTNNKNMYKITEMVFLCWVDASPKYRQMREYIQNRIAELSIIERSPRKSQIDGRNGFTIGKERQEKKRQLAIWRKKYTDLINDYESEGIPLPPSLQEIKIELEALKKQEERLKEIERIIQEHPDNPRKRKQEPTESYF